MYRKSVLSFLIVAWLISTRHSARQITRFGCWNKLTHSALATLFG